MATCICEKGVTYRNWGCSAPKARSRGETELRACFCFFRATAAERDIPNEAVE